MADRHKHVLLVEDNDDNAEIYRTILLHHGFDVTRAADGEEALRVVGLLRPDLILLDISLPKLDGWSVAAAIRSTPALKDIPILGVTAHAFDADRLTAEELGFNGYLAKPIEPRRLLKEVEALIGTPELTA